MSRPSPLSVAAGVVILLAMPPLLLHQMFSDFGSGAATVWLNPNHVRAGAAFAGLALAFGVATVVYFVRKPPENEGNVPFAVMIVLGALGGWALHRPLVSWWAHRHGYERCDARDRFQEGRTRRNDVTLEAWAMRCESRLSRAEPGARGDP